MTYSLAWACAINSNLHTAITVMFYLTDRSRYLFIILQTPLSINVIYEPIYESI